MVDRIEWFEITVPANTPQTGAIFTFLGFAIGEVVEIDVKVPPGPAGNLAFQIFAGGSQYIPRTRGNFIFPDDDYFQWQIHNAITSGSWGIVAYNTDTWPHIIQVSFQVNEIAYSPGLQFGQPIGL